MSDSFEFTLHNPLTEEDWNKISDAELEHTESITFQTPQGRQVKYIKCDVLNKIREEIKHLHDWAFTREEILNIIYKYKAESEGINADSN